jgi:hypothetical protein
MRALSKQPRNLAEKHLCGDGAERDQRKSKTRQRRQPAYPFLLIHSAAFLLAFLIQTYPAPMSTPHRNLSNLWVPVDSAFALIV